jgi:hypothetical protein
VLEPGVLGLCILKLKLYVFWIDRSGLLQCELFSAIRKEAVELHCTPVCDARGTVKPAGILSAYKRLSSTVFLGEWTETLMATRRCTAASIEFNPVVPTKDVRTKACQVSFYVL